MSNNTITTPFGVARKDKRGYYQITSRKEGNKGKLLHRLIFEAFYKIRLPNNIIIHHDDGNPSNNEIWNLIPLTPEEHTILHHKGKTLSEEHRQTISNNMKGEKHPNYGKHLSNVTREKIRQANTGHKHSEETKRKIGEAHAGKTITDEQKENMSKSQNNTGYFRVSYYTSNRYKKGYEYRYQWYENGKRKKIESKSLKLLKEKVLARGLPWKKLEKVE
jgi:hypothetical protein